MLINIYRIFLALFNVVYTVLVLVEESWAKTKLRLNGIVDTFILAINGNQVKRKTRDAEYVVQAVTRVGQNRLPKHLVFVIGRESPSFGDIVKVVGWCATAGVPCVSFYDHDGLLRERENEARKELAKSRPELADLVDWNSTCPVKPARNGINGTKHKMRVQLLSRTDGKREVALLAQSLGKGVMAGALKVGEVVPELLEKKLELGGLADPDLAIVCGKTCSTYGLLPWHIRTTEFLLLDTHHNLKVTEFVRLLEIFGKCEQRYGK